VTRTLPALVVVAALGARALAADPPAKEFAARHVLVAWKGAGRSGATRTKEEARARAEEALAELRKPGADFADVSNRYSDDAAAKTQGGFLGIFERGTMVPVFQSAVESLPEGGISGVVESDFGFHLIQRLTLREALDIESRGFAGAEVAVFPWQGLPGPRGAPPVSKTKEQALSDAKAAVEALRKGAGFDALPPTLGAVPLQPGWRMPFQRGRLRPEFAPLERAVFGLETGKVSDPVESPIGWLVTRRLPALRARVRHLVVMHVSSERRPPHVARSKEEARARAEEAWKKVVADPSAWGRVVAEYSDEPNAGPREGALGVVREGDMTPSFEDAIRAVPAGATSGVVETPFGYHVLQRLD
jgi:parvulin-like peptidyl-prolyl isomerase